MSIGFNWFKSYEIIIDKVDCKFWDCIDPILIYEDGDSTSFSAGNIIKCQNLFEEYGNILIPTVCEEWIDSVDYDLGLIEPKIVSEVCDKILADKKVDDVDMRDRIEWFKELSDQGYYFTYDAY